MAAGEKTIHEIHIYTDKGVKIKTAEKHIRG